MRERRRRQVERHGETVDRREDGGARKEGLGARGRQVRRQTGRSRLVGVVQFEEETGPRTAGLQQAGGD